MGYTILAVPICPIKIQPMSLTVGFINLFLVLDTISMDLKILSPVSKPDIGRIERDGR